MSSYGEWRERLPFDPAEDSVVVGYRRADEGQVARVSLALGAVLAVVLATGGGVAPPTDWGAAAFFGLVTAVFARGLLLAWGHLAHGGWHTWRRREVNEPAANRLGVGVGIALTLVLLTGAGGLKPAVAPAEAALAGLCSALVARVLLALTRWP